MPIIPSTYKPGLFYNRHLSTIYMGRLRYVATPPYQRQRIPFANDDFLDLDWLKCGSKKLIIISHGLEGSSKSHGVRSFAIYFSSLKYDVLALNFRGCSGEPNRELASYNSGSSDQLSFVVDEVLKNHQYEQIFLLGISVGGNITLKYLGENAGMLNNKIKAAVAISVPCDLAGSARALSKLQNRIYMQDFLKTLRTKIISKSHLLPEKLDVKKLNKIKTFEEFDNAFTAPIHGFPSAAEYYAKSSSLFFLDKINLPTLLLTARDDPFLSLGCFPDQIAADSDSLFLEASLQGGHVAFPKKGGGSWLNERLESFFSSN